MKKERGPRSGAKGMGGSTSFPSATNRDGSRETCRERGTRGYEEWRPVGGGGRDTRIEMVDMRGKGGGGGGGGQGRIHE